MIFHGTMNTIHLCEIWWREAYPRIALGVAFLPA